MDKKKKKKIHEKQAEGKRKVKEMRADLKNDVLDTIAEGGPKGVPGVGG